MGNIVGEGFDSRITGQVNRRQKTHGSGYNGETLRTNEELVVLNNNTAWIKLMSSVSIDDLTAINNPTIKEFGRKGADIAKAFVLFNGTSAYDNNETIQRGGIDFTNTLGGYNNVYGIGGSADFGLNPMMGITGIDVKHKNRGSIRTATVTVKAFNKAQFEIIDVLYMRLGFSVLLEWGNSMYFKNDDTYVSDGGQENSLIADWFKESNYMTFLTKIRNQSFVSNGNYDGMLAKVSNYHWSFQKDGSYDITIDLVSMGDVIESLNAGVSPNSVEPNGTTPSIPNDTSKLAQRLSSTSIKNKWGEEFYSKYVEISKDINNTGVYFTKSIRENIGFGEQIQFHYIKPPSDWEAPDYMFVKLGKIIQILEKKIVYKDQHNNNILNFDYNYSTNLIRIIKENTIDPTTIFPNNVVINQMSYNPFKCVTLKDITIPPANTAIQTDYVGINGLPGEIFTATTNYNDKFTLYYSPINFYIEKSEDTENFDVKNDDIDYGQIMNILVNVEFVLDVVDDKINKETGELPLIDFLKGILAGINESLGGINELDVWIDETEHIVKIIDKNSSGERSSSPTTFNLYGYNNTNNTSNFIHDFNLTTEITPALSTMITVAATSNKTVVGEDNTALSKINNGLEDRYKTTLKSNQEPPSTVVEFPGPTTTLYNRQLDEWKIKNNIQTNNLSTNPAWIIYNDVIKNDKTKPSYTDDEENILKAFFEGTNKDNVIKTIFVGTDGVNFIAKNIILEPGIKSIDRILLPPTPQETYLSAAYNLDQQKYLGIKSFWFSLYYLLQGNWTNEDIKGIEGRFKSINDKWNSWKHPKNPNDDFKSGFIPFNLSLTMDGLGGMKIYQKFSVDTDFMPSNYPSSVEFLIKNIQHTVKDNKWITKIESFCVSKPGDNIKLASTPTVTGAGLGLHSSITITSTYKSGSTKATYVATIDNGIPAVEDIVITFTDTLKNKDQSTVQPVPLFVTITIPKGSITSNLTEYTFSDAVYGAIEQSSVKLFPKFTVPKLGEKYYIQIGESIFGNSNIEDLITFTGKSGDIQHFNSLAPEFKKAFVELAQAYKTKTGKKITLNSAVRLQAEQTVLWNTWRAGGGNDPERPDYNKNKKTVLEVNGIYRPLKEVGQGHGAGTAVDVSPNSSELALLPEFKTLGFNSVDGDPPHIEIKYTPLKMVRLTLDNNSTTPYI